MARLGVVEGHAVDEPGGLVEGAAVDADVGLHSEGSALPDVERGKGFEHVGDGYYACGVCFGAPQCGHLSGGERGGERCACASDVDLRNVQRIERAGAHNLPLGGTELCQCGAVESLRGREQCGGSEDAYAHLAPQAREQGPSLAAEVAEREHAVLMVVIVVHGVVLFGRFILYNAKAPSLGPCVHLRSGFGRLLAAEHLCHAVGGAISVDEAFEWYPFHFYSCLAEAPLQGLGLPAHGHDVARGYGEVVVGIVHFVGVVDGNDFEAARGEVVHEREVLLKEPVVFFALGSCPYVAAYVFGFAGLGLQAAADHGAQVAVDDVEVGVEVHLHLPEFVVAHDDDGVVAEGVGLHDLGYAFVVGAHAASDEGHGAGGNVVASLEPSLAFDAQYGTGADDFVAEVDDACLGLALRGVHAAYDVASRGGDALVAREVEVHEWLLNVFGLKSGVVVGVGEPHGGAQHDAAHEVLSCHLREYHLAVGLGRVDFALLEVARVVGEEFAGQGSQAVDGGAGEQAFHGDDGDAPSAQHVDVSAVFGCGGVGAEVVFEQGGAGVHNSVEELHAGGVHQDGAGLVPFGLRKVHGGLGLCGEGLGAAGSYEQGGSDFKQGGVFHDRVVCVVCAGCFI